MRMLLYCSLRRKQSSFSCLDRLIPELGVSSGDSHDRNPTKGIPRSCGARSARARDNPGEGSSIPGGRGLYVVELVEAYRIKHQHS